MVHANWRLGNRFRAISCEKKAFFLQACDDDDEQKVGNCTRDGRASTLLLVVVVAAFALGCVSSTIVKGLPHLIIGSGRPDVALGVEVAFPRRGIFYCMDANPPTNSVNFSGWGMSSTSLGTQTRVPRDLSLIGARF